MTRKPGEHSVIIINSEVIGWIVETLPVTLASIRKPFTTSIPDKYHGFKQEKHETYSEAEEFLRKQRG